MAVDSRFYEKTGPVRIADLAAFTGATFSGDGDVRISDVDAAGHAKSNEVCYFEGKAPPTEGQISSEAGACFVTAAHADKIPTGTIALISRTPRSAHGKAAEMLFRLRNWTDEASDENPTNIHPTAVIAPSAVIGQGAAIGDRSVIAPNTVIGPGVQIGRDCIIGPNASIQCSLIGNRVKIYAGARIGEAGFGVAAGAEGAEDAPQFGRVILQDGVTIGANTCIDRGAFDDTIIGENSKIDNLCQIAHNVVCGRNVLMASFAGISGSVQIGDGVMFGGRVGIADHVKINEGAQIAAAAGVFREIPAGETWGGTPAKPLKQWMREIAWLNKHSSGGKRKT